MRELLNVGADSVVSLTGGEILARLALGDPPPVVRDKCLMVAASELPGPSGRWERQPRPGPGLLLKELLARNPHKEWNRIPLAAVSVGPETTAVAPTHNSGRWLAPGLEGGEVILGFVAPFLHQRCPLRTSRTPIWSSAK
jgi:hypothetical protein